MAALASGNGRWFWPQVSALIVVIINVVHIGGWVALGGAVLALLPAFLLGWLTGGSREAS